MIAAPEQRPGLAPLDADFRAELLSILTGTEPSRRRPCMGYPNGCSCGCKPTQTEPCECKVKRPDTAGYCQDCHRAVAGFFEAEREAA